MTCENMGEPAGRWAVRRFFRTVTFPQVPRIMEYSNTSIDGGNMQHSEILNWLPETDPARLADLWRMADQTRQECVGGQVHLRGLIEVSNHCIRLCGYCGLRAGNRALDRYRMSDDEILGCVHKAVEFGYGDGCFFRRAKTPS